MVDVKHELAASSLWSILGSILLSLSKIAVLVYAAKLLSSEVFGLAAIVISITAFLPMLLQSGLQLSIITTQESDKELIDSIFSVLLVSGLVSVALLLFFSDSISSFYGSNITIEIFIAAIGATFRILETVPYNILRTRLDYKSQNLVKIFKSFSFAIISITLFQFDLGVMILIVPEALASVFSFFLSLNLSKYKPFFQINKSKLLTTLNFGLGGLVSNFSNYFSNNSLALYLGKVSSLGNTGQYFLARRLHDSVFSVVDNILIDSIFPIFYKLKSKSDKVEESLLKYTKIRAILILPPLIFAFESMHYLISIFIGGDWMESIEILKIFIVVQLVRMVSIPSNKVLYLYERPDISAKISLFRAILYVCTIAYSHSKGISFVSLLIYLAVIDASIILHYMGYALKVSSIRWASYFKAMYPTILTLMLYWAIVHFFKIFFSIWLQGEMEVLLFLLFVSIMLFFLFFKKDILKIFFVIFNKLEV